VEADRRTRIEHLSCSAERASPWLTMCCDVLRSLWVWACHGIVWPGGVLPSSRPIDAGIVLLDERAVTKRFSGKIPNAGEAMARFRQIRRCSTAKTWW
jgi:hypothetical protein